MINMNLDLGGCAALVALVLSGYSTWKTLQFNRKQEELIESQRRLNNLLAEKEAAELEKSKRANLSAAFLKLGSNKHRLKIFNQGETGARNVHISFPDGNEVVLSSDIEAKFPLETLDRFQSVELIAAVHMSSPSKLTVQLDWIDDDGAERTKIIHPTL